ncbi:leucine-rich repeat, immunoglobulin-like domain and transmembrane domain-containing protein 1 [Conger conger]|uniref:leucine-rich repeat, immunoglobulin-like domain and transmembrane domain-containing protein 1 n=1 Tax=Conger conger TaxID=82655 RepID=UPI002A5AC5BE|nr:leucine-rich repeat, immunoglobulin-like domain and transmembrane domain-containing protein 1 [Conger conger]
MLLPLSWVFSLSVGVFPLVRSSCPSQCSCFYHNLSDGSKARSVICNDPEISLVPANFPADSSKLRIEKTAIKRIPSEAFYYLSNLECLWMSFNSLSKLNTDSFRGLYSLEELRLDGNSLTSFPWESLTDMPRLRLLDLHNNQMTSIPTEATVYIRNLTYLDLSSNNLVTLPSEVLSSWLSVKPTQSVDTSKMILGLHDNPWACDCRLFDLVQLQKASSSSSVAFIDTRLRCSAPEGLSGTLFSDAELRPCQGPRVHTAVARVRSPQGNGVLLRCGSTGDPLPRLSWRRADGRPINGTVQESMKEGVVWSILNVAAVSQWDSGRYICMATSIAGRVEAAISLMITDSVRKDNETSGTKKPRGRKPSSKAAAYQEKLLAQYTALPTAAPTPLLYSAPRTESYSQLAPRTESYTMSDSAPVEPTPSLAAAEQLLELEKTNLSGLVADASSLQQGRERVVRSVKVVGDTDHTVMLNWRAPTAKNTTAFNVLYAVFGERDMRKIGVGPGKNRITIQGLVPRTKYIACVCVRGLVPKKEQCVIFSTDVAASASGAQKLINVVVITVACVIVVPLTLIVCCGALKRRWKKLFGRKSKETQDSYVTFETLSPGTRARAQQGEYPARPNPEESNRLLSARSSLDSEATAKMEGNPNEYYC